MRATGRRVEFPLCGIFTFDAYDRLAGERIYYDRGTVMRQLGLFHESDGALGRLVTALSHPLTIARAFLRSSSPRLAYSNCCYAVYILSEHIRRTYQSPLAFHSTSRIHLNEFDHSPLPSTKPISF